MTEELTRTLLTATDARSRAQAAEQLARLGPQASEAAVALVRASGDRDASVRDWAVAALEELGPPPANEAEVLAALAGSPDVNIAYWACTLLGRLGAAAVPAVPAITDSLSRHRELAVRERAAWALGQIGAPAKASLDALEQAAQSGEPRLSRLARQAITLVTENRPT